MIRYLTTTDVYYSLNDVAKWLVQEQLLTYEQGKRFGFNCRADIVTKLGDAYEKQCVTQHLSPIVLPVNDYFVHWMQWSDLLLLLPVEIIKHRKANTINNLLGNPEAVYSRSSMKHGINLISLNNRIPLPSY